MRQVKSLSIFTNMTLNTKLITIINYYQKGKELAVCKGYTVLIKTHGLTDNNNAVRSPSMYRMKAFR